MTREELIEKMKEFEGTAIDFARIMNKSQSGIEEDIEHIRTSLRNNSEYELEYEKSSSSVYANRLMLIR